MRLIDADALKEFINNGGVCDVCSNKKLNCVINCDFPDYLTPLLEKVIDNAPTAEMRQGKWTDVIAMNNTLIYGCCDQCHLPSPVSLYCGSCGAKMTAPYNSGDVTDILRSITKGQG